MVYRLGRRTAVAIAAVAAAPPAWAEQPDPAGSTRPVREQNLDAEGRIRVNVGNLPANQEVSGTVSVDNFPPTQDVSGTVSVDNFPVSQDVSGAVSVDNLPVIDDSTLHGPETPTPFIPTNTSRFLNIFHPGFPQIPILAGVEIAPGQTQLFAVNVMHFPEVMFAGVFRNSTFHVTVHERYVWPAVNGPGRIVNAQIDGFTPSSGVERHVFEPFSPTLIFRVTNTGEETGTVFLKAKGVH